jgi:hypothetical protein
MYGAIIVSDAPRDTTRDHVIVAGGGGLPVFHKESPTFLLVNGSRFPRPLRMTVGDMNRIRIVSIHADEVLNFRFGTEANVVRWKPLARDGADLPVALQTPTLAVARMGPGETGDFVYVPTEARSGWSFRWRCDHDTSRRSGERMNRGLTPVSRARRALIS